jgi:[histone H3]-lysine36 N-trimethyltransferase
VEIRPSKRSRYEELLSEAKEFKLRLKPVSSPRPAAKVEPTPKQDQEKVINTGDIAKKAIAEIIEKAAAAAAAASKPEYTLPAEKDESPSKKKKERKHQTPEEKEANKEKRLQKLVGAVVVKCMSKYQKQMDHDAFKKHAKEVRRCFAISALRYFLDYEVACLYMY